jgi:hypothetical protein
MAFLNGEMEHGVLPIHDRNGGWQSQEAIGLRLGRKKIGEALQEGEDIRVGERHHTFVHQVVPEETWDGCVRREEDKGPLDDIHGDELGAEGRGVVKTMDQEDILVCDCIWGARALYHLGEKDGLHVFVSI